MIGQPETRHRRRCGSPTRRIAKASIRKRTLSNFTGTLQADGYAGFDRSTKAARIQEAACWAHVRRKFYDLHAGARSPVAAEALERIAELYAIEKEIRGRSPEERREVRNARARPLLDSLKQWLEATLGKLSQKIRHGGGGSLCAGALGSAAALRATMAASRSTTTPPNARLRAVALGRKNYLFAGSDAGGERAAAIYSLIGTAKLNGHRSGSLSARCADRIADHPDQPHRRTPALEHRNQPCRAIRTRRITNSNPCQHGQVRTLTLHQRFCLL